MITITRRLAQQLRIVLRRAFGNIRGSGPAVGFIAGAEGLTVKSVAADVAVEYRIPGELPEETLWLPFEFLNAVEGRKDDPVQLEITGNGQITVQWQDGKVPQVVKYDVKEPTDNFPALPTGFVANPPRLLQAMHEASEIADPGNPRYAIGCLQLCPNGSINATDGRQALIESGFTFPWSEPLLVPRSKVFHSPELQDKPVGVARSGDWTVLSVEPWTFYLRNNTDGRYPDMTRISPDPATAKTRCQLSADDSRFLAETLPKLPCHDEYNLPVTFDVNGQVVIRAKSADQANPTEVVLTNSSSTGDPTCININRTYLKRALKLGIRDFCFHGNESALLGQGENRSYIWMPLESTSAIKPSEDALRIESPQGEPAATATQPITPRRVSPMSEPTTNTNGKAASNGHAQTNGQASTTSHKASRRKASQQDIAGLIDQAVQFRTALHNLMQQSNGLLKALKQHRRKSRAIQSTLESLKQLKTLGV